MGGSGKGLNAEQTLMNEKYPNAPRMTIANSAFADNASIRRMTSSIFPSLDYTSNEALLPTHFDYARPQSIDEILNLLFAKIERVPTGTHSNDADGRAVNPGLQTIHFILCSRHSHAPVFWPVMKGAPALPP